MKPGESVRRRFDAAGSFPYECSFHPRDMQGSVVVSGD
jgi:plastocyanin